MVRPTRKTGALNGPRPTPIARTREENRVHYVAEDYGSVIFFWNKSQFGVVNSPETKSLDF